MAINFQPEGSAIDFQPEKTDSSEAEAFKNIAFKPELFAGPQVPESASTIPQFSSPEGEGSLGQELKSLATEPEFFVHGSLPTAKPDSSLLGPPSAALYNTFIKGGSDFLNTPLGLFSLGLGGLPSWAQKLAGLGFSAQMAGAAGEKAGEASVTHDPTTAWEAAFSAAPIPLLARPSIGFGSRIALTPRDALEVGARELEKNVGESPIPEVPLTPERRLGVRIPQNPLDAPEVAPVVENALQQAQGKYVHVPGEMSPIDRLRALESPIQETPERVTAPREGGSIPSDPLLKYQFRLPEENESSLRSAENIRLEEAGGIPKKETKAGQSEQQLETPAVPYEQQLLGKGKSASSEPKAAEVYGDVRPQSGVGEGQVPAEEGSGGIQPPREQNGGGNSGGLQQAAKEEINKFSKMGADEFNAAIKESGIGLTSMAYRLAERLTSEDIPALEKAQQEAHAQRKELTKGAKDIEGLQRGVALGMKGQMFNEAIKWRKALDEAKATNASMQEDFAALERKYGVGESRRYGGDLRAAFEREKNASKPQLSEKDQDIQRYNELTAQRDELIKNDKGFSPEDVAIWKQLEQIKNKYGGMPPEMAEAAVPVEQLNAGPRPMTDAEKQALNPKRFAKEQAAKPQEPPMEVESVSALDPTSGSPLSATDSLINKLEGLKLKVDNYGRLYSLPHPDAIASIGKTAWNNTLDVAIAAIKGGRAIAGAIDEAIDYLRKNVRGFDETKARNNLNYVLQQESKSGIPTGQQPNAPASTAGGGSGGGVSGRQTGIPGAPAGGVPNNPQARASLDDVYRIFEPSPKTKTPVGEKVSEAVEAFRTGFSSKFRPLDKLAEDIAKQYGTPSKKGIAGIFEQIKGSSGKAEADVYRFNQDVAKPLRGLEKDFNAYMFLRRTMDRLNQDAADVAAGNAPRRKVSTFTMEDAQAKLNTLASKVGPDVMKKFETASGEYQRFMDQALRLQVESGRMSPEVYNAIKSGNQFYAPFKVMKYLEDSSRPPGTGKSIDTAAEYTKAMEGIEDPNFKLGDMLSAARQSLALSRILADKNISMNRLTDLAGYDADGTFIKRLGPTEKVPDGMGEIHSFQNGDRVRYAVNKDVVDAVQIYGNAGQSLLAQVLGKVSIPFRAGATALNVPFQVSNLLADQPRVALVSKYGINGVSSLIRYPLDFAQAIISAVGGNVFGVKNRLFLDFLDSGAAGTTIQEHLTPNGLRFIEPSNISKSKKLAMTVLNSVPDFSTAIEQSSKIMGVQRAMRFHGVESGAELARQIPEAITEIRRFSGSPDFGRQGKWTEQARLNLLYMFLNARIQGATADLGRLVGRDGTGTAVKTWGRLIGAVGIPTVLAYLNNQSSQNAEDYAKRPQQEKNNYWLIPKDSYITNETGEKIRDYWRIPKRESSKWIANMIESALQFSEKRDPQSFGKFAQNMMEDISPVNIQGNTFQERTESIASSLNPLLKAPIEAATGRDMYRHKDIIPDAQKKASPENQYTDRTAEVFKKMATAMPDVAPEVFRSPLMLENMTKNLTAGLFTQFLPKKPVEGRTALENNPLLQRFQALPYTDSSEFEEKIGRLERESADEQLRRYRAVNDLMDSNKGKDLPTIAKAMVSRYGPDRKMLERVVDVWVANQRGIDSQERRVLALPVEQRAQYITEELSKATPDKKAELLRDYANKRILTESVAEKMIERGFQP